MKKKILLVANVAKEHVLKFHIPTIKEFSEQGWIVDVACSGEETVPCCHKQYKMAWERSPFTWGTIKGVRQLKKLIDDEQYDVVYCHTPTGGVVARLAAVSARKRGTKVIYCAHGFHFFRNAPLKNWFLYFPVEKILAHFTDVIFTVNREDYANAQRFFKKEKVRLVPEVGVDFTRLQIKNKEEVRRKYREELQIPEDAYVMIYAAELIPNKNQKMLIDTQKFLRNKGMDVYLLLPGPEHDGGVSMKYAEEQGMGQYCRFLGWRNDIGQLMTASDVCTASSIREGFGINLVEAMYCGLPVVATRNRGHEMVIKENVNGYLVDVGNSILMADYIEKIIRSNCIDIEALGKDIERYDCRSVAKELVRIIQEFA